MTAHRPFAHATRTVKAVALLIGATVALAACSKSETVHLRHAATGETVQCGPYWKQGMIWKGAVMQELRFCVEDFQRQGFEREARQ